MEVFAPDQVLKRLNTGGHDIAVAVSLLVGGRQKIEVWHIHVSGNNVTINPHKAIISLIFRHVFLFSP